jgi:hypothetical protein
MGSSNWSKLRPRHVSVGEAFGGLIDFSDRSGPCSFRVQPVQKAVHCQHIPANQMRLHIQVRVEMEVECRAVRCITLE